MCRAVESIGVVTGFLLLGGVNAVLYNITHYRLIQITSSTITPVIGGLARAAIPCFWLPR